MGFKRTKKENATQFIIRVVDRMFEIPVDIQTARILWDAGIREKDFEALFLTSFNGRHLNIRNALSDIERGFSKPTGKPCNL